MNEERYFRYSNGVLLVPMIAVLLIWTVFWIEVRFGVNLNTLGIYPRTLPGLRGIVLSPFIHGSLQHLYNNTLPLAVLSASLLYFYRSVSLKIIIYGILLSGLLTWLIGRPSFHIGASGFIYVLASFIFFKGVRTGHYRLVAMSLIVVFLYGGLLWYIFPIEDGISWEGHLSGLITGLILAIFLKTEDPVLKKYQWEKEDYDEEEDEFMRHFDEDGNFIESRGEEQANGPKIIYHYRKREGEDQGT